MVWRGGGEGGGGDEEDMVGCGGKGGEGDRADLAGCVLGAWEQTIIYLVFSKILPAFAGLCLKA